MSQVKCSGITYENFKVAINDPSTWTNNYFKTFETFDCNHLDRCVRRCNLCQNIMYDVNNHTLWMNAHVPHTYTAICLTKSCKKFSYK